MNDRQFYLENYHFYNIPIFHSPWYLDLVVQENSWDVSLFKEDNKIIGYFIYCYVDNGDGLRIYQPNFMQFSGPIIFETGAQKEEKYQQKYRKVMTKLFASIPNFNSLNQSFHHSIKNLMPINYRYSVELRYTYRISSNLDHLTLFDSFRESARRQVKKAINRFRLSAKFHTNYEVLINDVLATYKRQDLDAPFKIELLKEIVLAAVKNNKGIIVSAFGENSDESYGSCFLLIDSSDVFYLIGGADPDKRISGSQSLLIYEAISFALSKGLNFDFEGSIKKEIASFFETFGSSPHVYYNVNINNSFLSRVKQSVKLFIEK